MNDQRPGWGDVACGVFTGGGCLLLLLVVALLALPVTWPLVVAFEQGLTGR